MLSEIIQFKDKTYGIRKVTATEILPVGSSVYVLKKDYLYLQLIGREKQILWTEYCYEAHRLTLKQSEELLAKITDIGISI